METMNWLLCIFYVLANIRTMMLHIQVQPSFPSSAGFILSSFFSLNCCCLRGSRLVAAATMLLRYSSPFLFFQFSLLYIYIVFVVLVVDAAVVVAAALPNVVVGQSWSYNMGQHKGKASFPRNAIYWLSLDLHIDKTMIDWQLTDSSNVTSWSSLCMPYHFQL